MSQNNQELCVICYGLIPFLNNITIFKVFGCRTKLEDVATTMGNLEKKNSNRNIFTKKLTLNYYKGT